MSSDRTQHQSADELQKARELSLESTRPPSEIPGYKLQQFIGSGAYGEVWSAIDLKTGRRVAVKFYTRRSNADVQLLAQEVQKLVVLSNDSYVVGLLDVGWDADVPYYVMDYIESGSLEDRLKNGNAMPTSEAIELFQEIATGMMLLHGKGILHCDLKPGNVLLDQNGKPRVADFGQSRLRTEETPALGTLFYMAPEQADMAAIPDAGWDVYGLGALLYSMLTGKPPYYSPELARTIESSEDIGERLARYRKTLLTAPRPMEHRRIPGVDRGLAEIIDKCIAADPKRRYNNIQSVLLALRERELVRARRPLMLLGLIAPVLLMAVVSLFGWWAFGNAMEDTREAVKEKSIDSNVFAAKLAARSATEKVEEYFRVVGQLSRDQSFLDLFDEIIADEEFKKVRMELAIAKRKSTDDKSPDPEAAKLRNALRNYRPRNDLQELFLRSRMEDKENEFPTAASWFVNDRYGNQIASVFVDQDEEDNLTLGHNWSYRTYFTGHDRDLPENHVLISQTKLDHDSLSSRPIISNPHLSAVFKSKQSNTWKVAFSAPIIRYGQIEGIVAVTVELGEMIEFENINSKQYVMLVDTRVTQFEDKFFKGALLEHPLFRQVVDQEDSESSGPSDGVVEIDLSVDQFSFLDPLGNTTNGYDGETIVSRVGIRARGLDENDGTAEQETGLEVWAVQDYQTAFADVANLGLKLANLAKWAGLSVFGLILGMLLFVNGMMRESRERLARTFSPTLESSAIQSMETVAAVSNTRNATDRPHTADSSKATDRSNEI